ncbi:MAG: NAD(P)-dependent oxidoreductase [Ignavibacteriae bacterium HGW-Ignavibacteriae-2]|jgi:NAD(P)H dehydrogenase (quinone)|nr:MAG: NAD(P)-dependent oxidoreductase [Ignavibacteriae bacterium HGW-Ignavibacteriae-2]
MILITGASGHLGGATIDFLLKKNPEVKIKALVRSEEKGKGLKNKGVEVAIGNYLDYNSLEKAMTDVELLLLVSSSTMGDRHGQHLNVIKAAKQAGVKHIVYTSVLKADPNSKLSLAVDHVKTEKDIKISGIDYTILRNTYYADFLPMIISNAPESGTIYYSAGNTKVNFAARIDMAEANAVVLSDLTNHKNKIYEITSGNSYSFSDIAEMISKITNGEIKYVDIPSDTLKENIIKAGMPEEVADMMSGIADSMRAGDFDFTDPALENLIGRKPADLKEFLTGVYSK